MIINKQKAKQIVIKNLSMMESIRAICLNLVCPHIENPISLPLPENLYPNKAPIQKPHFDDILQFAGLDSFYIQNIFDRPIVDSDKVLIHNSKYLDYDGNFVVDSFSNHSILPLIFITKIVAEWADETLDLLGIKNISVNAHNSFTRGALFNQIKGGGWEPKNNLAPLIEFVLIRNAFTHRGNILEFDQKSNLEILEAFKDMLPITKLNKGNNLLDIPYSKYIVLFEAVIKSLI